MPVTMPVQRRQSGTSAALLAGAQPVQSAQEQQAEGFVSRHASFDSSSGANTPSGEAYRKVFMAPWTTSDQRIKETEAMRHKFLVKHRREAFLGTSPEDQPSLLQPPSNGSTNSSEPSADALLSPRRDSVPRMVQRKDSAAMVVQQVDASYPLSPRRDSVPRMVQRKDSAAMFDASFTRNAPFVPFQDPQSPMMSSPRSVSTSSALPYRPMSQASGLNENVVGDAATVSLSDTKAASPLSYTWHARLPPASSASPAVPHGSLSRENSLLWFNVTADLGLKTDAGGAHNREIMEARLMQGVAPLSNRTSASLSSVANAAGWGMATVGMRGPSHSKPAPGLGCTAQAAQYQQEQRRLKALYEEQQRRRQQLGQAENHGPSAQRHIDSFVSQPALPVQEPTGRRSPAHQASQNASLQVRQPTRQAPEPRQTSSQMQKPMPAQMPSLGPTSKSEPTRGQAKGEDRTIRGLYPWLKADSPGQNSRSAATTHSPQQTGTGSKVQNGAGTNILVGGAGPAENTMLAGLKECVARASNDVQQKIGGVSEESVVTPTRMLGGANVQHNAPRVLDTRLASSISVKLQGTRHHFRCECDTVYIRDDDTQRVDATNMYVTEEMLHEYSRSASAQEEMLRKYALRAQDTPTTSTQSAESKSCDGEKSTAVAAGGNSSRPVPATDRPWRNMAMQAPANVSRYSMPYYSL